MSAFGNPWGDKKGEPYVVNEDGWGWFGLGIIALVPVFYMGLALRGTADFISSHPVLIIIGFILFTLGVGAVTYRKKTGLWNPVGMIATTVSFMPVLLTEMLVEVPSIIRAGYSIGSMIEPLIEWVFITLIVTGIGVFIHAVNMLSISPMRHLVVGIVYCVITVLILVKVITAEDIIELKTVYGIIS